MRARGTVEPVGSRFSSDLLTGRVEHVHVETFSLNVPVFGPVDGMIEAGDRDPSTAVPVLQLAKEMRGKTLRGREAESKPLARREPLGDRPLTIVLHHSYGTCSLRLSSLDTV